MSSFLIVISIVEGVALLVAEIIYDLRWDFSDVVHQLELGWFEMMELSSQ